MFDPGRPFSGSYPEVTADMIRTRLASPFVGAPSVVVEQRAGVFVIRADGVFVRPKLGPGFIGCEDLESALAIVGQNPFILELSSSGGDLQAVSALIPWVEHAAPRAAVINGHAIGAAYWVAAACRRVYLTSQTVMVGGLGVSLMHRDISGHERRQGVKTSLISAGAFKTIESPYRPLSNEGRGELQARADYLRNVLCCDIARLRGDLPDRYLMQDARTFLGDEAIQAGLADGFSTVEQLIRKGV